jgi:hypothetical protein
MAATFAFRFASGPGVGPSFAAGGFFEALLDCTAGTTDYAAGGYVFGLTQLQVLAPGAIQLLSADVVNHWGTDGGTAAFVARFDKTNNKIQAFGSNGAAPAGLVEAANATANMNGLICTLRLRWR